MQLEGANARAGDQSCELVHVGSAGVYVCFKGDFGKRPGIAALPKGVYELQGIHNAVAHQACNGVEATAYVIPFAVEEIFSSGVRAVVREAVEGVVVAPGVLYEVEGFLFAICCFAVKADERVHPGAAQELV